MKILTVKEYLEEQQTYNDMSTGVTSEKFNADFAHLLKSRVSNRIIFNKNEPDCHYIKLKTQFSLNLKIIDTLDVLMKVYSELLEIAHTQNLVQIVVQEICVTPIIIDIYNNLEKERGIMVLLKYIK